MRTVFGILCPPARVILRHASLAPARQTLQEQIIKSAMEDCAPFTHSIRYLGMRIVIASTCSRCGETQIVSHGDGSLERWEREHICDADEISIGLAPAS